MSTEHPQAKTDVPRRSGWRTHSVHRCPFCSGIVRLALERDGAPVPKNNAVLADPSNNWYGSPAGWVESLVPGGLVAISNDHSHLEASRAWYANSRSCIYELWTTERGAVPLIDQLIDDWLFAPRPYWQRNNDGLRFEMSVTNFDIERLIKGGWAVRAKDDRGGPSVLLVLSRVAAAFRAETGKLPESNTAAQAHPVKTDFALLRTAFLTEIKATTAPRRS